MRFLGRRSHYRDVMRLFLGRTFAVFALAAGLAVPIAMAGSSHSTSAMHRNSTPSDEQIEATLHAKLAKSKIGKDGFRFHVQRGVVTWEGTTRVMQHKGAATRMAKAAGAVRVVNNIQISEGTGNLKKASVQP